MGSGRTPPRKHAAPANRQRPQGAARPTEDAVPVLPFLEDTTPEMRTQLMLLAQYYQGPVPPPEFVERYNQSIPNGGDRLMRMAELNQEHRQSLEKQVIGSDQRRANFGLGVAAIIALAAMGGGWDLISRGKDVQGFVFAGGTITALVGVFVHGSNNRRREREEKAQAVPKDPRKR